MAHQALHDSMGGIMTHLHARIGLIITAPVDLNVLERSTHRVSSEFLKEALATMLATGSPKSEGAIPEDQRRLQIPRDNQRRRAC